MGAVQLKYDIELFVYKTGPESSSKFSSELYCCYKQLF